MPSRRACWRGVDLLLVAYNKTYRETESDMRGTRTPWDREPTPDHTTLVRHMQTIPEDWMDEILAETARRCLAEAGEAAGPLASDSSALETTRYEKAERPDMKERDFVQVRQKIYWKYHVVAVLGLQIVLAAFGTPGNVNDTVMLRTMLVEIRRRRFGFSGRRFNADRGSEGSGTAGATTGRCSVRSPAPKRSTPGSLRLRGTGFPWPGSAPPQCSPGRC